MEKHNSSNTYDFEAASPQQILDNPPTSATTKIVIATATTTTNNSAYDLNSGGIYSSGPFSASMTPKQQSGIDGLENEPWSDYRNNNVVTAEYFNQGNMIPLLNSNNVNDSSTTFDNLYRQQIPSDNFPEHQFNYTQHRGSLPIMQRASDLLNATSIENMSATTIIDANITNINQTSYMRRYTEGSIPKYGGPKQRMNSGSSTNSNSNKGEDEDFLNSEEVKRKHFLERNRQAALKCRQRKKQWLANLQHRVEFLTTDNEQLQSQATILREEVLNLKTLLLAHRDCKVAQANGTTMSMIQNVSSLNTQQEQEQYAAVPRNTEQNYQSSTDHQI